MSEFTDQDVYILRHLQGCGWYGQPLSNFVGVSPMPLPELLASLKKLQEKGLLKLKGPVTLNDLEGFVKKAGSVTPLIKDDLGSWLSSPAYQEAWVQHQDKDDHSYFYTDVYLTWRGYFCLLGLPAEPPMERFAISTQPKTTTQAPAP